MAVINVHKRPNNYDFTYMKFHEHSEHLQFLPTKLSTNKVIMPLEMSVFFKIGTPMYRPFCLSRATCILSFWTSSKTLRLLTISTKYHWLVCYLLLFLNVWTLSTTISMVFICLLIVCPIASAQHIPPRLFMTFLSQPLWYLIFDLNRKESTYKALNYWKNLYFLM